MTLEQDVLLFIIFFKHVFEFTHNVFFFFILEFIYRKSPKKYNKINSNYKESVTRIRSISNPWRIGNYECVTISLHNHSVLK